MLIGVAVDELSVSVLADGRDCLAAGAAPIVAGFGDS
jgi:hypothetical protein